MKSSDCNRKNLTNLFLLAVNVTDQTIFLLVYKSKTSSFNFISMCKTDIVVGNKSQKIEPCKV